jgi:hypothetical protein
MTRRAVATFWWQYLAFVIALMGCHSESPPLAEPDRPVTREMLAKMLEGGLGDELVIADAQLVDEDLALLIESPQLVRVEIRRNESPFGDAALAYLAHLPNLDWINIPGGNVTDAGLAEVAALPKLRILNLHATQITDAGLASLKSLEKLELLRFGSPHVTDAGIEHIAALKSLRFLHLIDVPITDEALPRIAEMPQLESFYLDGGNATDAGLSALVRARPDLHFHQDQQHLADDPRAGDHSHGHDHGDGHGHSHDE